MNFIDSGEYVRIDGNAKIPDFPLRTVILLKGEPYDLIFYQNSCTGKRATTPWSVWKNTPRNDSLEGYLTTWFPADSTPLQPKRISQWNWQGLTEVFLLNEIGCCLKDVFIHTGDNEWLYPNYMGVKPKKVHDSPVIMHYANIMFNCMTNFKGKLLLGHGRENNILTKYDAVVEMDIDAGKLRSAENVTTLIKTIKQWMIQNPGYRMEDILQKFPDIGRDRIYWFI
ncbi:hypothetical protein [Selenomonas sp. FC4001]|uniref:hypothetical protein n=1 Tax=Selenomonas sp. FC4001 TaxID=1408313 RepID=UPI00055CF781|nr:hypothetical protein [Selenomonas sp. FC4001]